MNVLVTGARGRLGHAAAQCLIARGDHPVGVDLHPGEDVRAADVRDIGQLLGVAAGCDALIHCAAIPSPERHPPEVVFETNAIGTFNALETASLAGIRRVAIASSLSALGGAWADPPHPPRYAPVDEAHPLEVEDPYGLSKVVNERTAEMFHRRYGMTIACLRLGWILSDAEARAEAAQFASNPLRNRAALWGYIDERDATAACLNALDAPELGFAILNVIGPGTLATMPTQEALARYAPEVEIRAPIPGFATAFSIRAAQETIGFHPLHDWRSTDAG